MAHRPPTSNRAAAIIALNGKSSFRPFVRSATYSNHAIQGITSQPTRFMT